MSSSTTQKRDAPWMELDEDRLGPGTKVERQEAPTKSAPATVERRGFLKGLGISGVVTLTACERLPVRRSLPYLVPPEEVTPGTFVDYASTCAGCAASCGLKIATRDGRPIKLEGLPEHATSQGGLCATGQAEVRGLYDAGRLRSPTLAGKKSTWDELDRHVRTELAAVNASGKGVVVLAKTLVSPTARQTIEAFLAPFGGSLVEYDAPTDSASATLAAYEHLDGQAKQPTVHLEPTDLLVGLGADLLGAGPDPVAFTALYAARRRRRKDRDFEHVQIEGSLTLTGAAADERIQATTVERELIALWLLRHVSDGLGSAAAASAGALLGDLPDLGQHADRVRSLAEGLLRHLGRTLVVSGSVSVREQTAVALVNRLLGNEGQSIDLARPMRTRRGRDATTLKLIVAMATGNIGAVIFLACNPVEELPDGEALAATLGRLPLSVAITDRPNATAKACHTVAAAHHALESWGDAAVRDDLLTIAQPTIRPLFDTRHPIENFLNWSDASETDGRDYRAHLMASWRRRVFDARRDDVFKTFWNGAVSRGSVPTAIAAAARPATSDADATSNANGDPTPEAELRSLLKAEPQAGAGTLEVELIAEVALRDGRSSFNPWLREMPDPLTRSAWAGAVRVAPVRARSLGITDGDMLAIEVGKTTIEMPARVLPGQHPSVLGVPVGYGLVDGDAGAPARNGYQLARWQDGALQTRGLPATATKTGRTGLLPIVQPHPSSEGRPIIGQVSKPDEKIVFPGHGHHGPAHSLWDERQYDIHWEMVIDLDACTGCSACVVACQAENNLPVVGPTEVARHHDMAWLRIDRYFDGNADNPDVLFEPMLCAQCDNAPCETVCPVAATVHGHDGLNIQVYNRCVGTRYCANNCPYKVRRFNWFDYTPKDPVERMVLNPDVVVRERGVMEKCTFCVQRIQRARISAKRRGDTGPVQVETACQQSCPAKAIRFGDGAKKNEALDEAKHDPRSFQILADLGLQPSITYLARVRRRERKGAAP